MRLSYRRRRELRAKRHDQQHGESFDPVHRSAEHLQARGVGPVRILEDHQHRAGARQGFYLSAECFQRLLAALLGSKLQRGVTAVVRKRQHLRKKRRVLLGCRGLRQQGIKLVELCLWRVAISKCGGTFELSDDWMKGAVRVLGGAEIAQPRVRFGREALH